MSDSSTPDAGSSPLSPRPPFARVQRAILVENPWHRYCLDRYTRRDGTLGDYYYIDMPGSVGIIPLFADGSTLLIRQRRYLLGVDLWEFPIGGVEGDDAPLATGQRELREEAGLIAARWDYLGCFAPYKGVSNERCHFYLARELTEVQQHLEPEEDITVHRMPFAQARERLLEQELLDGQSLCGLLLFDRWRSSTSP